MGLFEEHVTDKEFAQWKQQQFTPLSTRLETLSTTKANQSDVKAVEAKADAMSRHFEQALTKTDQNLAEKLRAISKETHHALDQLGKTVSEGIPKELKSICENQISEIEKRLKEFEALTGMAVKHASECRQIRDQSASQLSAASDAADRAKASENEVAACAKDLQVHARGWRTLLGRLRWVLLGSRTTTMRQR